MSIAMTTHTTPEVMDLVSAVPTGMLIGGRWIESGDGRVIDVMDPATGERLAQVADGCVDDGLAAVAAASDALAARSASVVSQTASWRLTNGRPLRSG